MNRRGKTWQFVRRVPTELVQNIGFESWRASLGTDSQSEAERRLRVKLVETHKIIEAARNGSYRRITEDALEDHAVDWSVWYEERVGFTMPEAVFGSRFPTAFEAMGKPIGEEIAEPIIRTKDQLASLVRRFVEERGITIPSPDWDKLVTLCQDEYAESNPEIAGSPVVRSLGRVPKVSERRLSKAFERFTSERTRADADKPITVGSVKEFQVAVDRFIELFGDVEVAKISRTHARDFRDLLRQLPKRPPNDIRQLPLRDQVEWARDNKHPVLAKDTVAKLVGGLKSVLDQVAKHDDFVDDLNTWINPFTGFTGSGKRSHAAVRLPFGPDDLLKVFNPATYNSYRPSEFWIPLLLYYTGARRNEIAQLHLADVVLDASTPHLTLTESIAPDEDDDRDVLAVGMTKRIKTWSSDRVTPLVSPIMDIGFAAFVEHARSLGSTHLFKDIPHHMEERRADKLSQWFTDYLRKRAGVTDPLIVLHSLRHTFAMACEGKNKVAPDHKKLSMGHYLENEAAVENYVIHMRKDAGLLKELVHDKITFAPLDIKGLAQRAAEILEGGEWKAWARRRTKTKSAAAPKAAER
jgi:integrase